MLEKNLIFGGVFLINYILTAIIPSKNPIIFPIADILPLYKSFASGISSPVTMYSIAPAANANHNDITVDEIDPIRLPINAPTPVVTPDNITYIITLNELIPPFLIGTAIEIPFWYIMNCYCYCE